MDYMRAMNIAINGTINMKAAVINTSTNIVENIIIVDSMSDPVPDGYMLAEIDMIDVEIPDELKAIAEKMKKKNPNYQLPDSRVERPIHIGQTKWTVDLGFYD